MWSQCKWVKRVKKNGKEKNETMAGRRDSVERLM